MVAGAVGPFFGQLYPLHAGHRLVKRSLHGAGQRHTHSNESSTPRNGLAFGAAVDIAGLRSCLYSGTDSSRNSGLLCGGVYRINICQGGQADDNMRLLVAAGRFESRHCSGHCLAHITRQCR